MPTALITGVTGQDGSYLAEFLLEKNYRVIGMVRRTSSLDRSRLQHLYTDPKIYNQRLFLHYADLDDPTTMRRTLTKVAPEEIYHLAGQSHVGLSFEIPESTCEMTAMGTLRLLEMMRDLPTPPEMLALLAIDAPAPLTSDDSVRDAVRAHFGQEQSVVFGGNVQCMHRHAEGHRLYLTFLPRMAALTIAELRALTIHPEDKRTFGALDAAVQRHSSLNP